MRRYLASLDNNAATSRENHYFCVDCLQYWLDLYCAVGFFQCECCGKAVGLISDVADIPEWEGWDPVPC